MAVNHGRYPPWIGLKTLRNGATNRRKGYGGDEESWRE